ncbi:SH3 domain-containing protein [Rhodopila sp.]|uniref:SH3 domain-containing protein n=1 Tax=Rhodopila sp. TaxID=2480087 RepID=UPI002D808BD7|nr:SH3 domain-containing protein [Rhodopila sp.]
MTRLASFRHGSTMRFGFSPAASLMLVCVSLLGAQSARAESPPSGGTLQVPVHPAPKSTPTPPSAAPRTPVTGGGRAPPSAPVIKPASEPSRTKPAARGDKAAEKAAKTEKTDKTGKARQPAKPVAAAGAAAAASKAAPPETAAEAESDSGEKLPDPEKPEGQASKLPRFVSLRADEVNMRVGPGSRYRIVWVYKRRDLPVEIQREFENWRWVEDPDGIKGWVHQATLMGRRSFIVQKQDATLRSDPSDSASAVAILKPGVIGRIRSCEAASDWCYVQTSGYRGYLRRAQFWGALPNEAINP